MSRKYVMIYSELSSQIEEGVFQPDELLPSEAELINQYGVSRDTVRKALNMLAQNGYILKIKGKGSFVLDIKKLDFPVSGVVSFKEISKRNAQQFETFVSSLELQDAKPSLQKKLELTKSEPLWRLVRTRVIDGERVILDKDYLLQRYVHQLTEDIGRDSLYEYIENELNLKIAYANKEITVQRATEQDREYLDLKDFDMVAVVRSYTYLEDRTLFQYTESRHRPDKFKFVEFAKR